MSELPPGWANATLADLGAWRGGGTPSKSRPEFWIEGGIPWVSPKDMKAPLIADSEDHISEDALSASATNVVPAGSVLAVTRSGILRRTFPIAVTTAPVALNQDLKALVPIDGIDPSYVAWYLRGDERSILHECSKDGTTVDSIDFPALLRRVIPLAPHAEQDRIVTAIEEQFSRLDAGVAALERVRQNLKRIRSAVLRAAVTGQLLTEEIATVIEDTSLDKPMSANLNGENSRKVEQATRTLRQRTWDIPPNWTWRAAADVCEVIASGSTPVKTAMTPGGGDVPYIKVYNLTHRGNLDFTIRPTFIDRATHEGPLRRSVLYPGDILTNIVGPPLGKVSVVPADYPEWNTNQAVVVFRPVASLNKSLLKYWLLSGPVLALLESTSQATAGQFNVSLTTCRALPLPIPTRGEQDAIVAAIEDRLSVIEAQEAIIDRLMVRARSLRSAILAAAFSGRLVQQDPADEPASTLLERIASETASSNGHGTVRARRSRATSEKATA